MMYAYLIVFLLGFLTHYAANIARNKQLKRQLEKTKSTLAKKESELAACKREHKTVLNGCKYRCFETAEKLREAEQEINSLRAVQIRDFNRINCLTEICSNFSARLIDYQNARPELN